MPLNTAPTSRQSFFWWLIFASGVGLSVFMALRSQLGLDQYRMLMLGWQLVTEGVWLQHGMQTSAGGNSPGGIVALMVAGPLYLWRDHHSVAIFTALTHAVAFLLLMRATNSALTRRGMWLLLLLVWLNPWRMYYSAHIWNANFMFVAAVLHLASSQRMSEHRDFWATFWQVILIALAVQVHTSAIILAFVSIILFFRKTIQVHWPALVFASVLGIATYLPWLIEITNQPNIAPGETGFFMRGLIYVYPLVRGVLYWLKMPTLALSNRTIHFDFTDTFGPNIDAWLAPLGMAIGTVAYLTLLPSFWAHWRFVRNIKALSTWHASQGRTFETHPRAWLRSYIAAMMLASAFSFAISPTTVMHWQVFIAIPAAALILIFFTEALLKTRLSAKVKATLQVWWGVTVMLLVLQALGSQLYRCDGVSSGHEDSEMMIELNAIESCRQY